MGAIVSGIGGMLGLGGGAGGTSFAGPQAASGLLSPVSAGQANQGTSNAFAQQQLLQALQGKINTQVPGAVAAQDQLSGQLQGMALGQGPNPAQAMLNQQTGANVANQSALMAGQRGAGANVGLMARQAAQQGAATQQQAVGQGAVMQANQQIAAMDALRALTGQQLTQAQGGSQNMANSAQAYQQNLLNAANTQNANQISMQSNINSANAGMAGQQMQNQPGLLGGLANAAGAVGKTVLGGVGSLFGGSGPAKAGAAPVGPGGKMSGAAMAQGGAVAGPQSSIGRRLVGAPVMNSGGLVDVVVSPGEKIVSPQEAKKAAQGGKPKMATVPGRAEVKGDSLKNDKVQTKLPAGTVVVKRSRANNDPEGFIREVLSKRGKK